MNIFDLASRKKYTKLIVENASKFAFYVSNNKDVAGTLLLFFHCTLMVTIIFRLINNMDYICSVIWVLIIYSNYYFNGCILSRIEQVVFNDKTWCGPVSVLMYPLHLYYTPNKQIMNDYIKYFWCAPISTVLIFKYAMKDDIFHRLIGGVLFILLMPLLFIHSQCNIFDYLIY